MLDAAREAIVFSQGRVADDLRTDRMLLLSLIKEIEIVGEAASQISDETRSAYPEVPWAIVRAMRNRLIHAYADVNTAIVWKTIEEDLPKLAADLERILNATE